MTSTGGTGGPLTDRTGVAFLASHGYDSFSHIYAAGIDTSKPVGLFVWLHGDGAYEYLNPTSTLYLAGPNGIVAAAKERNCIVLVPLTPDSGTTNGRTWWKWGSGNAQYLRELIVSEIYGKYNIDLGKIWIAGFSGGAETTTAIFLPTQANNLQIEGGGFMPFGGGPRPSWYEISEAWVPNFDPAVFPGYWIVGENDTAENATDGYDGVLAAQAGYDWYGTKGIPTDIYYVPGQTHILSPEWGNLMRAAWVKYDSANSGTPIGAIGGPGISSMFVGSSAVTAVYLGAEKIWPSEEVYQVSLTSVSGNGTVHPLVSVTVPAGQVWDVQIQGTVTAAPSGGSARPKFRIGSSTSGSFGAGASVNFSGTVSSTNATIAMVTNILYVGSSFTGTVTIRK
jgi:hypothetical protein